MAPRNGRSHLEKLATEARQPLAALIRALAGLHFIRVARVLRSRL